MDPEENALDDDFLSDDQCCWTPDWHGVDCRGDCPLCKRDEELGGEG